MGPGPRLGAVSALVTATVVCAILVASTGLTAAPGAAQSRGPADVKIVTVHPDSGDRLWPYTSREHQFETLTLPINVVVRGNATRVRWFLMTSRNVNWNESEEEWQGVGGEEAVGATDDLEWYEADGATRYTYIQSPRGPRNGWVDETYQLHDGDYFGARYHIRAYAGGRGDAEWTAIQAHREHWDWFRLRHTVASTADARRYVERSFYGTGAVERVGRERYANGGIIDADGWVTVAVMRSPAPPEPGEPEPGGGSEAAIGAGAEIGTGTEVGAGTASRADVPTAPGDGGGRAAGSTPSPAWGLSAALLAGTLVSFGTGDVRRGVAGARRRVAAVGDPTSLTALALVSLLTLPSLRWASIAVERALPWLSPKVIAGLGYLVIAVGLPVAVVFLARGTRARRAAPLVAVGLGAGFLLDYVLVGIALVPVSVVLHRLTVVLAVGLFAAAGARLRTDRPGNAVLPVAAMLLWVGVLVWPLVDLL